MVIHPRMRACLLLLLALAAVYGPFVATGGLLAVGDGLGYYFPVRVLAALSLRMGEWPFWNPVNFSGMPLHGMLQAGVFFPGNWGFLVLPPVTAMDLAVLLSSFGAGLGMYAFARANGLGRLPGLVAALPYMLGGYLAAHLEELTSVQVVGLIPPILWAIERHARTRDARYAVAAAGFWGLQLLAGYPQTCLITLAIAAAYAWHRRAPLVPLAGATALGFGIAAVELWPVLDVIGQSNRMTLTYEEIVQYSLPLRQLPTWIFPYMFGGPAGPIFHVPYWGAGQFYSELMGYVGLAPLLLATVAVMRAERPTRFWLGLALVGLVLALGDATPIYHLWAKIPVIRAIRMPARHLLELDLAVCMLAAYGLDVLMRLEPAARDRLARRAVVGWGVVVVGLLLGLGLGHDALTTRLGRWLPPSFDVGAALSLARPAFWVPALVFAASAAALWRVRPAVLVLVLFLDLGLYAREQNVLVHGPRPGPLAMGIPDAPYRSLPLAKSYPYPDLGRVRALGYPTFGAFWNERSASGYEAFVPSRYGQLVGKVDNGGMVGDLGVLAASNHVLDLLGVRTLRVDPLWSPPPPLDPARWQPAGAGTYLNARALPRAWRVATARQARPDEVDRSVTADLAFDPARTALLEAGPVPATLVPGPATCRAPSPNRLVVETTGPGPGLVLVNERFDPGWQARLADGRPLSVQRADALVLAVEVPAGPQTVMLSYRPPGWDAALAASATALLLWLAWGWWAGYGRRPPARP